MNTINPRICPLGTCLFFGGFIRGGGLMNYLTYAAKTSLSKLLVSIILKEQSKFKHQSVLLSLSSSFVGLFEGLLGGG